jgi:DNA-binding transcriptional regulator YbjK
MKRMLKSQRRAQILAVAYDIAVKQGYQVITRDKVAEQAAISVGLVNLVFKTMDHLRRAVMLKAVDHQSLPIIAAGICRNCRVAHSAPNELKEAAMAWFLRNGGK